MSSDDYQRRLIGAATVESSDARQVLRTKSKARAEECQTANPRLSKCRSNVDWIRPHNNLNAAKTFVRSSCRQTRSARRGDDGMSGAEASPSSHSTSDASKSPPKTGTLRRIE